MTIRRAFSEFFIVFDFPAWTRVKSCIFCRTHAANFNMRGVRAMRIAPFVFFFFTNRTNLRRNLFRNEDNAEARKLVKKNKYQTETAIVLSNVFFFFFSTFYIQSITRDRSVFYTPANSSREFSLKNIIFFF